MSGRGEGGLPPGLTVEALAAAAAEAEPDSLAALTRLRAAYGVDATAAAVTQAVLRRAAAAKFGPAAATMLFTREGLEQATRPGVAAWHAARFRAGGATRVVDLGCGIGSDAMAFAAAGLDVVAVERDPTTAAVARANLVARVNLAAPVNPAGPAARPEVGARTEVVVGDAELLAPELVAGPVGDPAVTGVFCDPARRTAAGRTWRVEDFRPSWDFVGGLLAGRLGPGPVVVKLGPGLPHRLIPPGVDAEWVNAGSDTVEVCLAAGPGSEPGTRAAVVLPGHRLLTDPAVGTPPVTGPRRFLHEPVGAVIRAGAVATLAERVGATLLAPGIAYLTSDTEARSPFAVDFAVREVLPLRERELRRFVREHRIGRLEIKQRGIEGDPAALRRRLRPEGENAATLVLTRSPRGAVALVAERLGPLSDPAGTYEVSFSRLLHQWEGGP